MKNYIIGAIHFPPLPGYPNYPGFDVACKNALCDLYAFEKGGCNAVIIENNYDIPHKEKITVEAKNEMIRLGKIIRKNTKLPIGVSVLWNDYQSAFEIARSIGGEFIRIPVFVDDVKTSYGIMLAKADEIKIFRKENNMEDIKIFTDIHVKHAEIISTNKIKESALIAIAKGSDALIITGKWTGDAPKIEDLKEVREAVKDFLIICGSGVDKSNIHTLFKYANGAIVSTSLKDGGEEDKINIKSYEARISETKITDLVNRLNL
jgi:hypothetical protein